MCESPQPLPSQLTRRGVLGAAATAAVATVTAPMMFEPAAAGTSKTKTYSGTFTGVGTPDWHYVPVRVPKGVREIEVSYDYESTPTPIGMSANVIDIGMFDPSGHGLGNAAGFRGWSGGARRTFRISRTRATPGYIPGPITPGTWHVVLGPVAIVPPGVPWTMSVTLHFGKPGKRFQAKPAPRRIRGRGARWYRGGVHIHSLHSDGKRTLRRVAADARAEKLDFIVSTEHNTHSASLHWGKHTGDDLLVVNGEEVTTREGHWLAVGLPAGTWVDWRYRSADEQLPRFLDQVRGLGGMAVIAHPTVPIPGTGWQFGALSDADGVEVWNGPWTLDDEGTLLQWQAMLVAGTFVPALGCSDSHGTDQPLGHPQTVVYADQLSSGAVVQAMRQGMSYLAESSEVTVDFRVEAPSGSATCGERLSVGATDLVTVRLRVDGVPGCSASLIGATGPVAVAAADDAGVVLLDQQLPAALLRFVRVEVRRPATEAIPPNPVSDPVGTAMVAMTNPVFVDVGR